MADRLAVLFAKEPRAGEVKTRLCPPLSAEQAVLCHKAFTTDGLVGLVALDGVRVELAAAPDHDAPWLETLAARRGVPLVWQGPGGLGPRIERILRDRCARDDAVVIVGSDAPDLPAGTVAAAFDALAEPGVVIGPAADGGYYLIGCRGAVPPIFELDADWGSAAVLAETIARLRAARVRFELLPAWEDVDDYAALRSLAGRLSSTRARRVAPETDRVLQRIASSGVTL